MPIMVICEDTADARKLRKELLKDHLDYITTILDQVSVAGPTRENEGDDIQGSCFIYATDELDEAKQLFFNDPYYKGGIYQSYRFQHFNAAAGN